MDMELKSVLDSIRTSTEGFSGRIDNVSGRLDSMQTQLDAIDLNGRERLGAHTQTKSLINYFQENESVQRLMHDRKGTAVIKLDGEASRLLDRKSVITISASGSIGTDTGNPVGVATTGVLPIDRSPGITTEARYALRLRDVLYARPTNASVIDFVKVSTPPSIASPAPEGSLKAENSASFTSASEKVKTIATWIPATRQVLDDFQELRGYLDGALAYAVNKAEELQILAGDSTGENLHGIIPQAAAFNTSLLTPTAGWQRFDLIGSAVSQIAAAAELDPTFAVVNSADWWKMRLTKDGFGRYILGHPAGPVGAPSIWGIAVVPSNSIAPGTFLIGNGSAAAIEICDRMETVVEISTETNDFWLRNMVAIRAERREALLVRRPNAFVTGSFTSSPA